MATTDKPVTVRLPEGQIEDLMALSVVDDGNLAGQLRNAVAFYIKQRLGDEKLPEKIAEAERRRTNVLASLRR